MSKITNTQKYISLILFSSILYYISMKGPLQSPLLSNQDYDKETERKILDTILVYIKSAFILTIVAGVSFVPDTVVTRPHPIIWRILFSITFFYLLFLILLCIVHSNDARYLMRIFDNNLNKQLAYKSYGDNCDITTSTFPYFDFSEIYNSFDIYIVAHFAGWFFKYIAIRNFKFAMFLSILFEVMEITFEHYLNNFIECWWDHIILDILGMNLLGIIVGYYFIEYFNAKRYSWVDIQSIQIEQQQTNQRSEVDLTSKSSSNQKSSSKSKAKELFKRLNKNGFLNPYFINYDWGMLKSTSNFLGVIWLVVVFNLCDLSHFFLKSTLFLPITHYLLAIRIFMWGFLCIISIREYYDYLTISHSRKFGPFIWLSHSVLFAEWLLIYKISIQQGLFQEEYPSHIQYFWMSVFFIIGVVGLSVIYKDLLKILFGENKNEDKTEKIQS